MMKKEPSENTTTPVNRRTEWIAYGISAVLVLVGLGLFMAAGGAERGNDAALSPTPQPQDLLEQPDGDDLPYEIGVHYGDSTANVVVSEFSDYQCPACAHMAQVFLSQFRHDYVDTGDVLLVRFDLPLPQHQNAIPAAEAARCAEDQGVSWSYALELYEWQSEWSEVQDPTSHFIDHFEVVGGEDVETFSQCLAEGEHRDIVLENRELTRALGVNSTPTFFVDGEPVEAPGGQALIEAIEEALEESS